MKNISAFIKTIRFCLRLSWKSSRFYTAVRLLCRTASPLLPLLSSFALKYLIDLLSAGGAAGGMASLFPYVAVICACSAVSAVLETASQYCEGMHGELLSRHLRLEMMEISLAADIEIYDNKEFYNQFTALKQDMQSVTYLLWNTIDCISAGIALVGAVWAFASQNLMYCLVLVAASVPSGILANRYTKAVYHVGLGQIEEERKKNYIDMVAGSRQYAQEIRLFQTGPYLKQKYISIWDAVFGEGKGVRRKKAGWAAAAGLLPEAVMLAVLAGVVQQVLAGSASLGDLSLYTSLFAQVTSAVLVVVMRTSAIYENKLKMEHMETFRKLNIHKIKSGREKLGEIEKIEFKDVWFRYPFTEGYALRGLTFTVRKGQKVGIVGVNGAGKSTVIKLMTRLYDTTEGSVLINGRDIREYDLESLRGAFSCYFQNSQNYAFTVRENIQFSDIGREDEKAVREALDDGGISDPEALFPEGLGTYIGRMFDESGAELSEGQHQKIALARAFYRRCSVLVLDEPSSSLDPEAEYRLFERMKGRLEGKTVLYTSHRLSNIHLADYILVIEGGRLIEEGTKSELLANKKRFAQLYGYQVQKYSEGAEG